MKWPEWLQNLVLQIARTGNNPTAFRARPLEPPHKLPIRLEQFSLLPWAAFVVGKPCLTRRGVGGTEMAASRMQAHLATIHLSTNHH